MGKTSYSQNSGREYLFDTHCHLSPVVTHQRYENLKCQLKKKLDDEKSSDIWKHPCLNMMSTNFIDYQLIYDLSKDYPRFINPNYGVHPWFSHLFTFEDFTQINEHLTQMEIKRRHYSSVFQPKKQISDELLLALPVPIYFPKFIKKIERFLLENPNSGIGEIGIDKVFRVPQCGYIGSKECQEWINEPELKSNIFERNERTDRSPFRTSMDHQVKILKQFLLLARKLNRHVSLHCVGNDGKLFNILNDVFKGDSYPSEWIDLHSYSGSTEQIKVYTKTFPHIKFSISKVLNMELHEERLQKAFQLNYVDVSNILLETDLGLDGLYWEEPGNKSGKCDEDRYEFLISNKEGVQNRHTGLLKDTLEQLEKLEPRITLRKLNQNYAKYLGLPN